jgi:hypothetical protein
MGSASAHRPDVFGGSCVRRDFFLSPAFNGEHDEAAPIPR